jgi:hypothetical protein
MRVIVDFTIYIYIYCFHITITVTSIEARNPFLLNPVYFIILKLFKKKLKTFYFFT